MVHEAPSDGNGTWTFCHSPLPGCDQNGLSIGGRLFWDADDDVCYLDDLFDCGGWVTRASGTPVDYYGNDENFPTYPLKTYLETVAQWRPLAGLPQPAQPLPRLQQLRQRLEQLEQELQQSQQESPGGVPPRLQQLRQQLEQLEQLLQPPPQPGMQLMSATLPPGVVDGQLLQVETPRGLMQIQVPPGLGPGVNVTMWVP